MNSTYKIDFINNTLTMSKAFEAAASNPNSKEYKLLQQHAHIHISPVSSSPVPRDSPTRICT